MPGDKRVGIKQSEISKSPAGAEIEKTAGSASNETRRILFALALVVITGILVYSNTLQNPFVFDDASQIVGNPLIKDIGTFLSSEKSQFHNYNNRRDVGFITFALNHQFGGLDPFGYHLFNLVVHITNAILVYFLVILTFKTPFFRQWSALSSEPPASGEIRFAVRDPRFLIAFFSALFFVSHPLQTQAVTYVSQRFTSLATVFYLASIVFYIRARLALKNGQVKAEAEFEKKRAMPSISTLTLPVTFFMLSFLSAVLAMNTKEISFTLPVVIILFEFMFFDASLRKKLLFLLPILVTMIIIPLSVIGTDKPLGELLSDVSEKVRAHTGMARWDYLMTQMSVITTYLRLIFMPVNQNLLYDYPIYNSLFTPRVFFSFLLLSALFGTAVYLLYKSRSETGSLFLKPQNSKLYQQPAVSIQPAEENSAFNFQHSTFQLYRLMAFGIFWFFITLSVESSIIPIADVIFEHRVYLPSVGAFIALTASIYAVITRYPRISKPALSILIAGVLLFSGATFARNRIWQEEQLLWEDVVRKSPGEPRAHHNLGLAYQKKGMVNEAMQQYFLSVNEAEGYAYAFYNMGTVYWEKGMWDKAIEFYKTAITHDPLFAPAHNNLGLVYQKKGFIEEALKEFQTAVSVDPNFINAHYNLGNVYFEKGIPDKAIDHYKLAIKLKPDYAPAHNNLGLVFFANGSIGEAIEQYRITLSILPEDAKTHFNLGMALMAQGSTVPGISHLEEAVRLDPSEQTFRIFLADAFRVKRPVP